MDEWWSSNYVCFVKAIALGLWVRFRASAIYFLAAKINNLSGMKQSDCQDGWRR